MRSLLERILDRLFRVENVTNGCAGDVGGSVYLKRWHLRRKVDGINVYLHKIMRPDLEREVHDHPWSFVSLILWGGYWEETPAPASGSCRNFEDEEWIPWWRCCSCGTRNGPVSAPCSYCGHFPCHGTLAALNPPAPMVRARKWPGMILVRGAEWQHRLHVDEGRPAWTLFITGPKRREWGFWNRFRFTHWKQFQLKRCKDSIPKAKEA